MDFQLVKVISGGQTGADMAGLDAAIACGYQAGGTATKGWRIQNYDGSEGTNPKLAEYGLVEHSSRDYPPRTKQNVMDADGTVWFGWEGSPGGRLTISTAKKSGKHLIINPTSEELRSWLIEHQIKVLNVAGNRHSEFNPTIYDDVYQVVKEAIAP